MPSTRPTRMFQISAAVIAALGAGAGLGVSKNARRRATSWLPWSHSAVREAEARRARKREVRRLVEARKAEHRAYNAGRPAHQHKPTSTVRVRRMLLRGAAHS